MLLSFSQFCCKSRNEVAIMSVCIVLCLHDISGHQHNQYNFNFKIVNFLFLDGDVPRSLPMVYTFRNLFVLLEFVLMLMT